MHQVLSSVLCGKVYLQGVRRRKIVESAVPSKSASNYLFTFNGSLLFISVYLLILLCFVKYITEDERLLIETMENSLGDAMFRCPMKPTFRYIYPISLSLTS